MKSLVIMAAGMGSRYGGGGLKQIDEFGPHGEKIMDYSIYDAIRAGFEKIIFVIREDFSDIFATQIIGPLQQANPDIVFVSVFQQMDSFVPEGFDVSHREKPWGTAHAILVTRNEIDGPFCVINADDRYGPGAFVKMVEYFNTQMSPNALCMVGYILENTLSPHGVVNRGVCEVSSGVLTAVHEHLKIAATGDGETAIDQEGKTFPLDSVVSMNFWGFHVDHIEVMYEQFQIFIAEYGSLPKKERFIAIVVEKMMEDLGYQCDVMTTTDPRCGVSYKEDKPFVQQTIQKAIDAGTYPQQGLWNTGS